MAAEVQVKCTALVPVLADRTYQPGETVVLPVSDAVQLARWKHVLPPSK